MYDGKISKNPVKYLIDIDLETHLITVNDDQIEQLPWYKEFIDEYDGKTL